jgi:hypothetical protein
MAMDRTARFQALVAGISIGSEEVTAGTLSGLFKDLKDGSNVMVGNWHVFKGHPGKTLILQPGRYDGGRKPDDVVGILKRYVPLNGESRFPWWKRILCVIFGWLLEEWCLASREPNYVDAACATFYPSDPTRKILKGVLLDDGRVIWPKNTHPGDGIEDKQVWKSGRSSGVTFGTIVDDSATVKVWYGDRYRLFADQLLIQGRCAPGDSGSPVFLMARNTPSEDDAFIGLLFAGTTGYYVACKYKWIKKLLEVSWE